MILVKHGLPVIVESEPSETWVLSDQGRADAERLARALAGYAPRTLVASTEPKATDTARAMAAVLGLSVETDPGLVEHQRLTNPFRTREVFEAAVARFFAEPAVLSMGEETADQAHARFAAAVARRPDDSLIVAHGTVISLWVSRKLGLDPFPLWKRLGLAEAVVMAGDGRGFEIVGARR